MKKWRLSKATMIHEGTQYGNKTVYGVESDVSKYTWEVFLIFVAVSSLIGDTTILIASLKYKAIKLHKIIIVIIQHIAFCDLMVVLTDVVPKIISAITEEWVLSDLMCRITPYARYFFIVASFYLICAMTTSKMFLIKYPLRFERIATKNAHFFSLLCWMGASVFPIVFLMRDEKIVYFSYRDYNCVFNDSSPTLHWLKPLLAILLIFIPACLVVVTTILILVEARKVALRSGNNLRWQGRITAVASASFFCISVIPLVIYRVLEPILKEEENNHDFFFEHFYRVVISFPFINTISNFYIYCLTVASFREFVLSRVSWCWRGVRYGRSTRNEGKNLKKFKCYDIEFISFSSASAILTIITMILNM